jgi:hypothetical protein
VGGVSSGVYLRQGHAINDPSGVTRKSAERIGSDGRQMTIGGGDCSDGRARSFQGPFGTTARCRMGHRGGVSGEAGRPAAFWHLRRCCGSPLAFAGGGDVSLGTRQAARHLPEL